MVEFDFPRLTKAPMARCIAAIETKDQKGYWSVYENIPPHEKEWFYYVAYVSKEGEVQTCVGAKHRPYAIGRMAGIIAQEHMM